jgi:hypothetical protein
LKNRYYCLIKSQEIKYNNGNERRDKKIKEEKLMGLFSRPQEQQQAPQQQMPFFTGQPTLNFNEEQKDDLTRHQLDLSRTKSDIAHWLNGDFPKEDANGKPGWDINLNDNYKVLNDFGIREVMRIVNIYLSKDVIMSNLKEERINQICMQIGEELNDIFFTKYDEIGLDTDSKLKNYSSIIVTLTHIIYITLMRAESGKERISVTENRIVNQTEITQGNIPMQNRGGGFLRLRR